MLGTFMAILDASIVNVALPHMMSAMRVDREQIEWVTTAFMLATAVSMPLVGWLVGRLGHKALYLGSLAIFTLGSAACALAWSYDSLIVARIIQALGGGAVQPVGMAIVADLFAPHERGRAIGIWGTGIMIGPALGPTLGGYLTDWFSWRAIFSVNLPVGMITLLLGAAVMRRRHSHAARVPFDAWGFSFLTLGLIGSLLALSNGQDEGWGSPYILTCLACGLTGLTLFVAIELVSSHPLLDLKLFAARNFSLSMVLAVFRSVGLFGGVFLLPIFLENLLGFTTIKTGLWMMPGALAVGVMMPISGRLADRFSPRWLVTIGSLVTASSLFMYGGLDLLSGPEMIVGPQIVRGLGLALMMTPLLTAALNAVPRDQVATASSFLNVAQRLGGAFGIALLNNYLTHASHMHAVRLGEQVGSQAEALHRLSLQAGAVASAAGHGAQTLTLYAGQIMKRATVLGFDNAFMLAGIIVLAGVPLCLLLRPGR